MNQIIELFFNSLESGIITLFILFYFEPKSEFNKPQTAIASFILNFASITIVTFTELSWLVTLFIAITVMMITLEIFFDGSFWEHLLIAVVINSLLIIVSISVSTLIIKLLNIEYSDLVDRANLIRYVTMMINKVVFVIAMTILLSIKKKHIFLLKKLEYAVIVITLVISGIIVSIVRNIIYDTKEHCTEFLILVLSLLCLNIVQYYIMVYISNQKINEKTITVLNKQLDMQKDCIRILEEKYNETAKLRHDMKNYLSCALEMSEQGKSEELNTYLSDLVNIRKKSAQNIINIKRPSISAVVNSKFNFAESMGFRVQCVILSEMENIHELDAAIMLANLLDNAIEACEKNTKESEIVLKIWHEAAYYCLEISNTVETNILQSNPQLLTSKENHTLHGFGLKSIKDIVKKYNGYITFEQISNRFFVRISLNSE